MLGGGALPDCSTLCSRPGHKAEMLCPSFPSLKPGTFSVEPPLTFSGGSGCKKKSTCNAGDLGLIPGLGRSLERGHGNPLQYFCLENPHGQRSVEGYSPWGHKEVDTTERLSTMSQ